MMKGTGSFKVDLKPMETYTAGMAGNELGRMSIDKQFEGDLEATSKGEMLSAVTGEQGSAGYVAIEQVRGSLSGRKGGFILQHFGVMDKGSNRLILEVVPDSAVGELEGLRGTMTISIEGGMHYYEFEYGFA